jgi:hypothetical protein
VLEGEARAEPLAEEEEEVPILHRDDRTERKESVGERESRCRV